MMEYLQIKKKSFHQRDEMQNFRVFFIMFTYLHLAIGILSKIRFRIGRGYIEWITICIQDRRMGTIKTSKTIHCSFVLSLE